MSYDNNNFYNNLRTVYILYVYINISTLYFIDRLLKNFNIKNLKLHRQ